MIEKVVHYRSRVGMEIARREFSPVEGCVRGGVVLLHGIGEHTARYGQVMRRLTERGMVCVGVDWPGHGISPGKRGHIDSLEVVHTLVHETVTNVRARLQEAGRAPVVGLVAHSMGALLALDYLRRFPDDFGFAWVNAPPLDPAGKRSRAYIGFARGLEVLFPRWTVHNGIKSSMCFETSDREFVAEARKFCHSRISLRLGVTLLETAREVRKSARRFKDSLELLVTQGGADPVCSPAQTRAWFETLELEGKSYREFPGHLHECWRAEEVVDAAVEWIGGRFERRKH